MQEYQVKAGETVDLTKRDPNDTGDFQGNKQQARAETGKLNKRLQKLQEVLYAEHKQKILVILQGMDTTGKDGVIRHVFAGVNPQGVRVANFKVPTPAELDHDYSLAGAQAGPGKGELVIFNRSHYEEVLIVRVHELGRPKVWKRRFDQINEFERCYRKRGPPAEVLSTYR